MFFIKCSSWEDPKRTPSHPDDTWLCWRPKQWIL